ncbi:metalloprotease [Streptomyces sp. NPDC048718]|uniref:metalloprotease n=1 Tax=Streptomyces sp. NPDC048718 TaxID=3365587 RepID=UPI00371A12B3
MSAPDRTGAEPGGTGAKAAGTAHGTAAGRTAATGKAGGATRSVGEAAPSGADRAAAVRAYRPEMRPGVVIGPAVLRGPRTVHLVKHPVSGATFEIGPKEQFVLSLLDGTRGQDDVVAAYAERFRLRLPDEQWIRLLGLLGARGLLAGAPDPAPPEPAPAEPNTFWKGTRSTVSDAHRTASRLHRILSPFLGAWLQVPLVLASLVMIVAVLADPPAFWDGMLDLVTRPLVFVPFAVFLWFSICLHELAHGIAARRYGGVVTEIGLRWRFPTMMMYCTVDNYLFLPGLRAKLVVAAAGAHINLVLLLPFALWWALIDPADPARPPLTGALFIGIVQALSNLVPLPPLDGYRILSHLVGAVGLAPETRTYLMLRRGGGRDAVAAYPARARRVYTSYAVTAVGCVLLAVAGSVTAVVLLITG